MKCEICFHSATMNLKTMHDIVMPKRNPIIATLIFFPSPIGQTSAKISAESLLLFQSVLFLSPHLCLPHISLRHRCLISQTTVTLQNPSTPNWRSRQRATSTSTESNRTGGQAFYAPPPLAQSRWPPSRVPRVALAVYREWVRNRQRILIYNTSERLLSIGEATPGPGRKACWGLFILDRVARKRGAVWEKAGDTRM